MSLPFSCKQSVFIEKATANKPGGNIELHCEQQKTQQLEDSLSVLLTSIQCDSLIPTPTSNMITIIINAVLYFDFISLLFSLTCFIRMSRKTV